MGDRLGSKARVGERYAHHEDGKHRFQLRSEEMNLRGRELRLDWDEKTHDFGDDVGEALHVLHQLHDHRRHIIIAIRFERISESTNRNPSLSLASYLLM